MVFGSTTAQIICNFVLFTSTIISFNFSKKISFLVILVILKVNILLSTKLTRSIKSDTFALLPIKHVGMKTGEIYVDFSGALQDNKRIYFGPVNIDRIHIKLLDDRGNTVDLHGSEWCITLISENLYQY